MGDSTCIVCKCIDSDFWLWYAGGAHSPEELAALGLLTFSGSRGGGDGSGQQVPVAHPNWPCITEEAGRTNPGQLVHRLHGPATSKGKNEASNPSAGGTDSGGPGSRYAFSPQDNTRFGNLDPMLWPVCGSTGLTATTPGSRIDGLPGHHCKGKSQIQMAIVRGI